MKRILGFAIMALLVGGCAEGRLNLSVDILSFISDAERAIAYGPVSAGVTDSARNLPQQVEFLEGFGGVVSLDTVQISGSADIQNTSGNATFEFRVFFDSLPNPFGSAPAIQMPGTVQPGQTTPVTFDALLPPALTRVFEERSIYVGVEVIFISGEPPGGASVAGQAVLTSIVGRIVGVEDIFGGGMP